VGPVIGGWLIDLGSWRAIFLINLPLAAGALGLPIFGLAFFLVCAAQSTHVFGSIVLAMGFFVLAMIAVGLVNTTLHAIYTAALYRFATGSKTNAGIDGDLLAAAYWPK
jgi:MFS family permease